MSDMDMYEWLRLGIDKGWISEVKCFTHDWLPVTEEEEKEFDDGYDPCVFAVRVWDS